MKRTNLLRVLLLLFVFIFSMFSCSSLLEIKLKDNPDFVKNAHQYLITHPITYASNKTYVFIIEDVQTKDVFHTEVQWSEETQGEGYIKTLDDESTYKTILDIFKKEMDKGDRRDFVVHTIDFFNPIDHKNYEVLGLVSFFRQTEKESYRTTFQTTTKSFPVEFWIFEQGKDVGKVEMHDPRLSSSSTIKIDIFIHDKLLHIEFEEQLNKRKVSFEYENQLVAFFDLKPAAFISTKKKGNVLIRSGLSKNFIADIFSSYILTDIISGTIRHI